MIICLGAFDGYHRGHRSLFREARRLACDMATDWRIVTFFPHPRYVLGKGLKAFLFTENEKQRIRSVFDLPEPLRIPFTKEFAETSPREFLDRLCSHADVTGIVVGENFRFGRNRSGDGDFLAAYCAEHGIVLSLMPQVFTHDGIVISSTRIRDMVQAGKVDDASSLLGYPYFMISDIVPGYKRGRMMGFPTANMKITDCKLLPREGVYAGGMYHGEKWYPAAVSVGRNPTFLVQGELTVEAFLLDYSGDLYGVSPTLAFFKRLRPMLRFNGAEDLARQVESDSRGSRAVFNENTVLMKQLSGK